mmetsp:Transcript_21010/g.30276  ORF Transcript_21010/g.30276 Transcript_21010/m.30276 type:complete len:796 (+) Transcript_21010:1-2388(+)
MGGAGAGGGGLMMAGQQTTAMTQGGMAPPPPGAEIPGGGGGGSMGVPVLNSALAADLVDKSQLTSKQAKNLSHLPIVAIDMYGSDPVVAMFPPKPKTKNVDADNHNDTNTNLGANLVGKFQPQIHLNKGENSHKILRKYLTKDKTYDDLKADTLASSSKTDTVLIDSPHRFLGIRRIKDCPNYIKSKTTNSLLQEDNSAGLSAAISEEASQESIFLTNGSLDGVSTPSGDDFDRLVYKVRLAKTKKAVTLLPEEATRMILSVAQSSVARKHISGNGTDQDDPLDFPVAIALPAWACHDASVESWMDACPEGSVFFQRSVAALCGGLQPSKNKSPNLLHDRINKVLQMKEAEHQKENDGTDLTYTPLVVTVGLTKDGVECTAIEVAETQNYLPACLFGNYRVICSVSIPDSTAVGDCIKKLYETLEYVAPELDGPVGFLTYSSNQEEMTKLKTSLETTRRSLESWENVPIIMARPDVVAIGTATLAGVTHGRLHVLIRPKKKPKAHLALRVQNVAPTAVGVRMTYDNGKTWTPVKTVFDFDRRVPAGPYPMELTAAECAAMRETTEYEDDEALQKATAKHEGRKGIPKREEAALAFQLEVVQKWTRTGEWIRVGDIQRPLTKIVDEAEQIRVACEKNTLELSLAGTGIITQAFEGQLETVVQATTSARNSKLRYYIGVILAIAFFGGFLVKSYWEEHVFNRDTARLLTYYKNVLPGSLADGDERNARYLVWKYRNKKQKLWKRLEVKYGEPVLEIHEWPEPEEGEAKDEEIDDLDDAADEKGETQDEEDEQDEPDL